MRQRDVAEAGLILRRLLEAVDSGDLDADGPVGANVVRQMEGAAVACEIIGRPPGRRETVEPS